MHDVERVEVDNGFEDLLFIIGGYEYFEDESHVLIRELGAVVGDDVFERAPFEVFHDQVEAVLAVVDLVKFDYVLVVQLVHYLNLLKQSFLKE